MLYIVRHGIAADVGEGGVRYDADRPLTSRGKKRTEKAALGLARLDVKPARIVTSPFLRAKQTAEIIGAVLAPKVNIGTSNHLKPAAVPRETVAWLASEEEQETMLVGHMPDLAHLTALLLTRTADVAIAFKKASVCCLSFDGDIAAGQGCLEWLLQPKHLCTLGKKM